MYQLIDTFNNRVISRHRTAEAAYRAGQKLQDRVKRANGQGSYIPTKIVDEKTGKEQIEFEDFDCDA